MKRIEFLVYLGFYVWEFDYLATGLLMPYMPIFSAMQFSARLILVFLVLRLLDVIFEENDDDPGWGAG